MNIIKNFTPGTTINNRYIIKSLIATGGMASTFLAQDKIKNTPVVLKTLSISSLENWKTFDLFKREISVLKNINHPQIPDYIDHFSVKINKEDYYILVQEYVDGSNLYDLVKKGKKFTIPEIKLMLKDLLTILSSIHRLQPPVIHRDINPKNIIIDKNGKIYLVDFSASGFIRKTTLAASKSDTFVGTIGYMPPEQLYGKVLPQSDLYSLGVTIIFVLTGREPSEFEMDDLTLDYKPYADIPAVLENLLDMMINPHSSGRPASAEQALSILDRKIRIEKTQTYDVDSQKPKASEPLLIDLYKAIESNNKALVKRLLTLGARINPYNPENKPPLKLALELSSLSIAKVLINYGADVNAEFAGRKLLHDAVLSGSIDQVLLLLKYGADVNARDTKFNKTALQYAYENGYYKIYNLLLKHGARTAYSVKNKSREIEIPPPPRPVPFRTRSLIKYNEMDAIGFIFAIKGLLFVFVFVLSGRVIPAFFLTGADSTAHGRITHIENTNSIENEVPIYKYFYEFPAEDGKIYTQYSFTTGRVFDDNEIVPIHYISSNPVLSVIEGARHSTFSLEVLFVLILPIVGYYFLGYNKPLAYKYIMLLKWGKITSGKILYKKRTHKKYQFIYEYEDENLRKRRGKYKTENPEFTDIGQTVPVIYLDNQWLEFSEIVDKPVTYKDKRWFFESKDSGKKWAVFTALLRGILWLVLAGIIVMTVMGISIG